MNRVAKAQSDLAMTKAHQERDRVCKRNKITCKFELNPMHGMGECITCGMTVNEVPEYAK